MARAVCWGSAVGRCFLLELRDCADGAFNQSYFNLFHFGYLRLQHDFFVVRFADVSYFHNFFGGAELS